MRKSTGPLQYFLTLFMYISAFGPLKVRGSPSNKSEEDLWRAGRELWDSDTFILTPIHPYIVTTFFLVLPLIYILIGIQTALLVFGPSNVFQAGEESLRQLPDFKLGKRKQP
jgi:hypothetical protein